MLIIVVVIIITPFMGEVADVDAYFIVNYYRLPPSIITNSRTGKIDRFGYASALTIHLFAQNFVGLHAVAEEEQRCFSANISCFVDFGGKEKSD